jgi:hypothetical protein
LDVPLLEAWTDWVCPNGCPKTERTPALPPNAARFHPCPRVHGLTVPLAREGTDCRNVARLREDYEGADHGATQLAPEDGRPYMSAVTEHADGHTDVVVFAPVARASLG